LGSTPQATNPRLVVHIPFATLPLPSAFSCSLIFIREMSTYCTKRGTEMPALPVSSTTACPWETGMTHYKGAFLSSRLTHISLWCWNHTSYLITHALGEKLAGLVHSHFTRLYSHYLNFRLLYHWSILPMVIYEQFYVMLGTRTSKENLIGTFVMHGRLQMTKSHTQNHVELPNFVLNDISYRCRPTRRLRIPRSFRILRLFKGFLHGICLYKANIHP